MPRFDNAYNDHRRRARRTNPGAGRFCLTDLRCIARHICGSNLQELTGLHQLLHAVCIGHPPVMTNAMQATGQNVDEKAANELVSGQCHGILAGAALGPIVLPLEGDALLI